MSAPRPRSPQLAYSDIQEKTRDADRRRRKADKFVRVLQHFLGVDDLCGLRALDVGSSTGFTAAALSGAGCDVIGVDIDVPGLTQAKAMFGGEIDFLVADGSALPFLAQSIDIVLFNQVYEHVVDAPAVMAEIRRVLKADGVALFGFGNKHQVIEPHYRLPFLSWLPDLAADRYVSVFGRADHYYERFLTRRGLQALCEPLALWDYTFTVLCDAERFAATDVVPRGLRGMPSGFWKALTPIMPTFLWIGTPGTRRPKGAPARVSPRRVDRGLFGDG